MLVIPNHKPIIFNFPGKSIWDFDEKQCREYPDLCTGYSLHCSVSTLTFCIYSFGCASRISVIAGTSTFFLEMPGSSL